MSNLDWTEFDPELLAANIAARDADPDTRVKLHPHRCGPCVDCLEHLGHEVVVPSKITLKQFIRHAELFGTECVAETAIDSLTADEMVRLQIELDAIEAERRGRRFTVGKRRRRSELETARYAHALAQELSENGLIRTVVEHRVAEKLGVSDPYARRMLKLGREMYGNPENAPSEPSVQAKSFATKAKTLVAVPLAGSDGKIA